MTPESIRTLLERVQAGEASIEAATDELRRLPFADIGVARVDTHRALRQGMPEVILGSHKAPDDIVAIMHAITEAGSNVLVTRVTPEAAALVTDQFPQAEYCERARAVRYEPHTKQASGKGDILVVTAGTSDIPVAEEAAVTAEFLGNPVRRVFDAGVAGIHRLLGAREELSSARVIIVVAGMEGALPSVVGGLVDVPVIAVPTSVGYGASFGGLAALLGMLNSCAAGVTVVNIDNGFGAATAAHLMNRL